MHAATSLLLSVLIFLAFSLVLADSTTTVTTTIPMTTTTTIKSYLLSASSWPCPSLLAFKHKYPK
jgi:hypothetical protein